MDMQTSVPNSRQLPPQDELFDDFDFKPLSPGLGFHHGNKASEAVKEATRVVNERASVNRPAPRPSHPFEQHRLTQPTSEGPRDFIQNDLALFYQSHTAPEVDLLSPLAAPRASAPVVLRLVAFLLDLILIAGMTAATLGAVSFLTDLPVSSALAQLDATMWTTALVLFSGYFLLYFTLLESAQGKSLGKDLLGLELQANEGLSMAVVCLRTLATLLGFISLGLTNAVELPAKLTATRIVRQ